MPSHDIIDNRNSKLVDHITAMLGSTEMARFAVGYFFVSGLEAIQKQLGHVKEIRLLIGSTTNSRTLEEMAEGHHRLKLVNDELETDQFRKRAEVQSLVAKAAENVRSAVELMDQTDAAVETAELLVKMIQEKRLKVRVYTKGRMHAKAYIFTYGDLFGTVAPRYENGIAVVGSSNLTLAGVSHNTELNVVVSGNNNHAELCTWFDALWDESKDFDEALMEEMKQSWALAQATPYDIYMKTLYSLVKTRLDEAEGGNLLWDDDIFRILTDFQQDAVRQAVGMIRKNRGVFLADVVGLGKSYIGAAIVKHFERTERRRTVVLCPATLVKMWEQYSHDYDLNAKVVSMGRLTGDDGDNFLLDESIYAERDFLLIDESHNLRNLGTQRYNVVSGYMGADPDRRCCLLTATPRNRTAWDVYNQIKLFHPADKTDLPIAPADLRKFFVMIEKKERNLPDLLAHVLIRRTRNFVMRYYGYDSVTDMKVDAANFAPYLSGEKRAYVKVAGNAQYFPKRLLETVQYSIEDTYQGLYQELRNHLGKSHEEDKKDKNKLPKAHDGELSYARYGLFRYVKESAAGAEPYKHLKATGPNLRGLARILLFKRFESSVHAFRKTVGRFLESNRGFLMALEAGMVPAGERAQDVIYQADDYEEQDFLDALRDESEKYHPSDFHFELLKKHLAHDISVLEDLLAKVDPITPERDAKLQTLLKMLPEKTLNKGKRLIFTQYADTAEYLYKHVNRNGRDDVDVITGTSNKSKFRIVGRFAPNANPDYSRSAAEPELNTIIATDVLSEGLNMQDCDTIFNYDLHWNPVRLIQRFGRIDRIGSTHDKVLGYNFLPETKLDDHLHLKATLEHRIREIQETIGEDSAILDPTEQVNEEALYAIYSDGGSNLDLFEPDEPMGLGEAEGIIRQLKTGDPEEFKRIASLRDGIRSGMNSLQPGMFVFCQAGDFQQLFFVDPKGEIETRDTATILGRLKCTQSTPSVPLSKEYNAAVMKIHKLFSDEVDQRNTLLEHSVSRTPGQQYVGQELKAFHATLDEDDPRRTDVSILERAYSSHHLSAAVQTELRRVRSHKLIGESLFKRLRDIYDQHHLLRIHEELHKERQVSVPRIICSEAMV